MKKRLAFLISMMMALACLAGCAGTADTPSPDGEQSPNVEQSPDTGEVQPLPIPENTCDPLIEYDPEREIYFTCHNQYYTIYRADSANQDFSFLIFSKEPLDLSTLELDIPIESDYIVSWGEVELQGLDTEYSEEYALLKGSSHNYYPYYLYAYQRGMDFKQAVELYEAYRALYEEIYEDGRIPTDEELAAVDAASAAYREYRAQFLEDYLAVTEEQLPQFYVYGVTAIFFNPENLLTLEEQLAAPVETFTSIDITIEGVTYHEEVGEITLDRSLSQESLEDGSQFKSVNDSGFGGSSSAFVYTDGLEDCWVFQFTAEKAMTITGLTLQDAPVTAQTFSVQYEDLGITSEWNGTDPLYINAGESVSLHVVMQSSLFNCVDYRTCVWGILTYETADGKFFDYAEETVASDWNLYEEYYILYEGMYASRYWTDFNYAMDKLENENWPALYH